MHLKVRYFAAFREAAGCSAESVESMAATPEALFEECKSRHSGLDRYDTSMVAINDELAQWNSSLSDGDEVLFFPPVAGG